MATATKIVNKAGLEGTAATAINYARSILVLGSVITQGQFGGLLSQVRIRSARERVIEPVCGMEGYYIFVVVRSVPR